MICFCYRTLLTMITLVPISNKKVLVLELFWGKFWASVLVVKGVRLETKLTDSLRCLSLFLPKRWQNRRKISSPLINQKLNEWKKKEGIFFLESFSFFSTYVKVFFASLLRQISLIIPLFYYHFLRRVFLFYLLLSNLFHLIHFVQKKDRKKKEWCAMYGVLVFYQYYFSFRDCVMILLPFSYLFILSSFFFFFSYTNMWK